TAGRPVESHPPGRAAPDLRLLQEHSTRRRVLAAGRGVHRGTFRRPLHARHLPLLLRACDEATRRSPTRAGPRREHVAVAISKSLAGDVVNITAGADELLHRGPTTRVLRRRRRDGSRWIYKELLGPEAAERARREIHLLERIEGVAGVPRLAPTPAGGHA